MTEEQIKAIQLVDCAIKSLNEAIASSEVVGATTTLKLDRKCITASYTFRDPSEPFVSVFGVLEE